MLSQVESTDTTQTVVSFKQTAAVTNIGKALERWTTRDGMLLIHGPSGSGKTIAIERAAAADGRLKHVRVTSCAGGSSPRSLLMEIAHDLGLVTEPRDAKSLSAGDLLRKISGHLRTAEALLVLDHCEKLPLRLAPTLRDLADTLPRLVLVGDAALVAKLGETAGMAWRTSRQQPVGALSLDEVHDLWGHAFSADYLAEAHALSGGLIGSLRSLLEAQQTLADKVQRSTREYGALDARATARTVLLAA